MKEPEYVAATLKWCNERRKEDGQKPLKKMPKGHKRDGTSCPCGKASGVYVGIFDWYRDTWPVHKLPKFVTEFVNDFDAGKLPQYEL